MWQIFVHDPSDPRGSFALVCVHLLFRNGVGTDEETNKTSITVKGRTNITLQQRLCLIRRFRTMFPPSTHLGVSQGTTTFPNQPPNPPPPLNSQYPLACSRAVCFSPPGSGLPQARHSRSRLQCPCALLPASCGLRQDNRAGRDGERHRAG